METAFTHKDMPARALDIFAAPAERFINRELSWLEFNSRVVAEAHHAQHPLLERVKFLSISASNLDEFFMVRVAGLNDQLTYGDARMSQDGLAISQQLEKILARASTLMHEQALCWQQLSELLLQQGISVLGHEDLQPTDMAWLEHYFMSNIFPAITPIAVDPAHPFPFLPNKSLAAILELNHIRRNKLMTAILPLPSKLPRFVMLPGDTVRYVPMEIIVEQFVGLLYPGYERIASGWFRILRDSDLDVSEDAEDLMRHYENALKERRRGIVIRLKVSKGMPVHLREFVVQQLHVDPRYLTETEGMLGLANIMEMMELNRPDLKYTPYTPRFPERIVDYNGDCLAAIRAKDILIHHPYESFDVVVQFLRQAAKDEDVISIKQTLYRTSNDSPIVRALIEAAESGKSVTAVVELRARFDEEANIRLARDLERAGVQVVYGFVNLKTHAKVSLVTKRVPGGLENYVHFGTGNYHPITAKIYTDLSFFTCAPDLCLDAAMMFNYLTGYAAPRAFGKIALAPHNMRKTITDLIYKEIEFAESGRPAHIWAKLNSLVDPDIIDALYFASQKGVKINLIVRGVCCLRPGIPGFSENIHVKSIVGRFLEHSRIFCFGNGHAMPSPHAKVYLSSADWMVRNLDYRVEYMAPLENPTVHEQVLGQIMVASMEDNVHSWRLRSDGSYERVPTKGEGFSAHDFFMHNPSLSGRGKALRRRSKTPSTYTLKKKRKKTIV